MNNKEFYEWLDSCPGYWEVNDEGEGYIVVSFPTQEYEEDESC